VTSISPTQGIIAVLALLVVVLWVLYRRSQAEVAKANKQVAAIKKQFRLAVGAAAVAMNLNDDLVLDLMRRNRPIDLDTVAHIVSRSDEEVSIPVEEQAPSGEQPKGSGSKRSSRGLGRRISFRKNGRGVVPELEESTPPSEPVREVEPEPADEGFWPPLGSG
jgi:type II secretory pathway pseudopilin PulG